MNQFTRREFLQYAAILGLIATAIALLEGCGFISTPTPVQVRRIGFLSAGFPPSGPSSFSDAYRQKLRQLGWTEGQNIIFEFRYAEGNNDRLPILAAELVSIPVDVIVADSTLAALPSKEATRTIPIVMYSGDALGTGIVTSLAHPGGNVTGVSGMTAGISGKRLELLKEAVPGLSRVAILWDAAGPAPALAFKETEVAARAFGVPLQSLEVRGPTPNFASAFEAATGEHANALIVISNRLTERYIKEIVELAAKHRLPAMYYNTEWTNAGGLISYGPNDLDLLLYTATFVDKILKGAKPADLPVEQPTRFDFIINLKTAKALGLTLPQSILAQATEVIQ